MCVCRFQYISQTQSNYYGSPSTAYAQKLAYSPASASTPQQYISTLQQQSNSNQGIQNQLPQASTQNGAIHYGSQSFYQPSTLAKYGYTQITAPQKYYYATQ